jgi:type IV pilus biogenesis/stability protein PilW
VPLSDDERAPGGLIRPAAVWLLAGVMAVGTGCASGGNKRSVQDESGRLLRLAYVQLERGQTQEALASANDAVKRDPKNAEAHNFVGLIYMSQSDYPKAAVELKEAVRLNPFFTDAHNNLGVAYRETKQYDKALAEFEAALKDKTYKSQEKVQLNLGHLYLDQGVMAAAVQAYERAVSINPNYALGFLALGTAYQKMGRKDEAIAQFKKVVALAPDTPEAQRARQEIESGAGRSGS